MIQLRRIPAPARTQRLLSAWTTRVKQAGGNADAAREKWNAATAPKKHVRALLEQMAHGPKRCMYCEDSLGTDIDHFEPIALAPLRAFDWSNHLLACSFCNSNAKRQLYPCDGDGNCLLIDPTVDDPAEHLVLLLASGEYDHLTLKGSETIRVFDLNRADLVKGRRSAFTVTRGALIGWHTLWQEGNTNEAAEVAQALGESPFAGVRQAMEQLPPSAVVPVMGSSGAAALQAWRSVRDT